MTARKGPGKVTPPDAGGNSIAARSSRANAAQRAHRMVDRPTVAPLVPDAGAELPRPAKPPSKAAAAHVEGCRCGPCKTKWGDDSPDVGTGEPHGKEP